MFSVIIPLYNKAPYIEKAIQSVQAQTCQEFELIVVDDGSTDNSLEIVKQLRITNYETTFDVSQLRIIEQQNSGVSVARNNGVKAAKYDCIAFLDADDWWAPTFLEEMKALITELPEAGIYGSSYFYVKNHRNRVINIGVDNGFKLGYINYFQVYAKTLAMPLWTSAVVVKKEVFDEMQGFKSYLKLGEDFDLWLRIALKYKVAFLNKPLAYYNQDVVLQNRAVGKLHNPQTHILWNLDYLAEEEQQNADFKQLLDNMRAYSLFPYYLDKKYRNLAKQKLAKVDWIKQPKSVKRKYELPIWYLKMRNWLMKKGSMCKTFLLKTL